MNKQVREESRRLAVPLNAADSPDMCDFIVPSLIRKGPVLIAVSTSGLLPLLAKSCGGDHKKPDARLYGLREAGWGVQEIPPSKRVKQPPEKGNNETGEQGRRP